MPVTTAGRQHVLTRGVGRVYGPVMAIQTADGIEEPPGGILEALHAAGVERRALAQREAALVRRARNDGIVWEQIAACLGVTTQTVHRKYAAGLMRR